MILNVVRVFILLQVFARKLDLFASKMENSVVEDNHCDYIPTLERRIHSDGADETCLSLNGNVAASQQKRTDYLGWNDYFMAVAFLSAQRSKDPSSQVGACIVNPERKIVGIGYNGMPNGCSDDNLPWARKADSELETKYPYGA